MINEVGLMEVLLRLEAEAKYVVGATDRAYEQTLMDELVQIVEEAESLLGPRGSARSSTSGTR